MKHFSLCSGIGGLDLAAEWAGFETVAQCEIDDYASKVLAKNFKGVPNLNDIRTVTNERLRKYGIDLSEITVISAGFPCQPYSLAGKGRGDSDERDLWGEVARVLGEIKPCWFVGENTPGLFARQNHRYFRRVLNDLTALGYNVGWGIWGACDVGAPHKRDRVFIVAHANGKRRDIQQQDGKTTCTEVEKQDYQTETLIGASSGNRNFSDSACESERGLSVREKKAYSMFGKLCNAVSNPNSKRELQPQRREQNKRGRTCDDSWWQTESDVGRVAYGISARVDKLRCLGNAVVPQQAYPIFEAIANYEKKNSYGKENNYGRII